MQELVSIKWNIIRFDEISKNKSVSEIIKDRFNEEDKFLGESSLNMLYDPYSLKDMDKAVKRIKEAHKKWEKVIIFWDYDVDWVTATSLLMHFFTKIWLKVSYRLPHRVNDWYWLKEYFIDEIAELEVGLIVTVDCWTRDVEVVKYARQKNIDVIITDHHSVPDIIPEEAIAILNPKRPDCEYCNKNLSGAWVAFKLIEALSKEFLEEKEALKYIEESIDVAALWTVADCMEITWENRIIVKEWLKQIKNSRSFALRKLIEDKMNEDLDADIFSFLIWPKLNAAWRMDSPYKAVNLILNNWDKLNSNLSEIEKLNEKRKYETSKFYKDAEEKINHKDNILFYISPAINHWIIWIVAWRLCENYNKPTICLKDEWDKLVASCRSPEFFSIIDILEKYKDMFLAFGGHKQAAWFSISKEKFGEFKTKIINELNDMDFSAEKKSIDIDKIIELEEIGFCTLKELDKYKPYWIGNPKPIFMIKDFNHQGISFLGSTKEHLKFNTIHWFKVMAFGMWNYYLDLQKHKGDIDIIFELSEDWWNWNRSIMLRVVDLILK